MKMNVKMIGFFVAVFILAVAAGQVVRSVVAQPGSSDDPIVTKSYVDQNSKFAILQLNAGQTVVTGESAEFILRSGDATAIAGANGGLSDVTSDTTGNLVTGDAIVKNHLIISARNDGRGLKVTSATAFLMIKGAYTLQ
jgi:hypothetical protein